MQQVTIPMVEQSEGEMTTQELIPPPEETTVLVVEDEKDTRDVFGIYLQDYGYQVRMATNGTKALRALDETVDIVLLDRRMPDMAGKEVLAEIRTRSVDCRVAMVTAVAPQAEIAELPLDDYITKPISGEALCESIEQLRYAARYEETLTEYYRLSRLLSRLQSSTRDRPAVHVLDSLQTERDRLITQLEALATELPDDVTGELAHSDPGLSV